MSDRNFEVLVKTGSNLASKITSTVFEPASGNLHVAVFLQLFIFANKQKKMIKISNRLNNLAESATLKMAAMSRSLIAEGKDVIALSLGEPDFETPHHIREAAKAAIDAGHNKYTPVNGLADLRKAISNKFMRDNGLDYSADQIVVSTGAKQSLANVINALIDPGDEVIVASPFWVSYAAQVQLAEGKLIELHAGIERDFKVTPDMLEAAITDKTKIFLFSSPCNPTGAVYSKEELQGLAEVIGSREGIYVVADEIYEHINFIGGHQSIGQFDCLADRVVTVNGLSKGFAMTGWRLGYIGAPTAIAKACTKMQGQITSGTCVIAQMAAIEALGDNLKRTYEMREAFLRRRNLVLELLGKIPGLKLNVPEGAFYVFPDASAFFGSSDGDTQIKNVDDLCMYLLEDANVAVVTGSAFGNDKCFRISYAAADERLIEAAERIKVSLGKLQPVAVA